MTKTCSNCGRGISDEEYDIYNGFCTNCLQSEVKRMARSDALPYTSCRYCTSPAVIKCSICGKPLCPAHIMVRKTDTNPTHGRCRDCVPRTYYSAPTRSSSGSGVSVRAVISCIALIILIISIIAGV